MKNYVAYLSIVAAMLAFGCEDDATRGKGMIPGENCQEGDDNCESGGNPCKCDDGTDCPDGIKDNCVSDSECKCDDGTDCPDGIKDNCTECKEGDENCEPPEPPKPKECVDSYCEVGSLDCSGTKVVVCEATDDGCGEWKDKEDCGIGKYCDLETHACVEGCLEKCETENEKRCVDNSIIECVSNSAGCAVWNMVAACGAVAVPRASSLRSIRQPRATSFRQMLRWIRTAILSSSGRMIRTGIASVRST